MKKIQNLLLLLVGFYTSCYYVAATSIGRTNPLSHISPVTNITIHTPNHIVTPDSVFSITIELPSTGSYSNIERRWLALSDPNASNRLQSLKSLLPFLRTTSEDLNSDFTWADGAPVHDSSYASSIASDRLFRYLTRNSSTAEYPLDTQLFKLVLEPNLELTHSSAANTVFTLNSQGQLVPHPDFSNDKSPSPVRAFKGTAYRQTVTLNQITGSLSYGYKRVGWARITVHGDNENQVEGAWKVDDEEGLGLPAAIYHISRQSMFEAQSKASGPDIAAHEQKLLVNLQRTATQNNNLVVWRDADMHPTMYKNFDLLEDDVSYAALMRRSLRRRQQQQQHHRKEGGNCNVRDETSSCYDPELHLQSQDKPLDLIERSGESNDTGGSGFSSGTNLASTIGVTSGCPDHRKIALIGLAGDCNFLQTFSNTSAAREDRKSVV